MNSPHKILSEYWGFRSFRPKQEDIIIAVLDGSDTVALLPTGGGKSVCYQIPAIIQDGICVVISPLVALINDQVDSLRNRGIKALKLVGGLSSEEVGVLLDNAIYGNYKFLYLSPERLQQERVQNAIKKMNINLIAIDEAHCISQWGNDFRPAYKNIDVLKALHPLVPTIALTATATEEVLEDTIAQLQMELPKVFRSSFKRDNIAYEVYKTEDKIYKIQQELKSNNGSAIIYVRSRKSCLEIHQKLKSLGLSSTYFHGGISATEKQERLQSWLNYKVDIMVATSAFGMGIDHPDVRFVFHYHLPESLESYYQEAGRAGRDGDLSKAIVLYDDYDEILVKKQFVDSQPTIKDLKFIYRKLCNYFQIPYGEGEFSDHSFSFNDFCATYDLNNLIAYNSLNSLDRLGIIQLSKEFGRKSIMQFLVPTKTILAFFDKDQLASVIGKTILRIYGGIFETATKINLNLVSKKSGQSVENIIQALKRMEDRELIDLKLYTTDASVTFIVPREDDKTLNPWAKRIEELNRQKKAQVKAVLDYVKNNKLCKSVQLLAYFDEKDSEVCGICSVCNPSEVMPSAKEIRLISEKIMVILEDNSLTSREISEKLIFKDEKVVHVLRKMLDASKIILNSKNEYGLK